MPTDGPMPEHECTISSPCELIIEKQETAKLLVGYFGLGTCPILIICIQRTSND